MPINTNTLFLYWVSFLERTILSFTLSINTIKINSWKRRIVCDDRDKYCVFCFKVDESKQYIFGSCDFNRRIWTAIVSWLGPTFELPLEDLSSFPVKYHLVKVTEVRRLASVIWLPIVVIYDWCVMVLSSKELFWSLRSVGQVLRLIRGNDYVLRITPLLHFVFLIGFILLCLVPLWMFDSIIYMGFKYPLYSIFLVF